jgi:DNA-binding NarL/FixJ family response regulator
MRTALIVEDVPKVRTWLELIACTAFPGVRTVTAGRRDEALQHLQESAFDLALVDLGLPDGNGTDVVKALRLHQPQAVSVVITIYGDDEHLFPALQAGAFGYLLKDQTQEALVAQLLRMANGEPPLSPPISRRVLAHFATAQARRVAALQHRPDDEVALTERETEVLQRVAKGYTLPEIARQFELSRHTVADYIKQVYKKLNVSSRAEAALEAARRGLVQP